MGNGVNDMISRQVALDKFKPWLKVKGYSEGELNMLRAVIYELENLPPVQPKQTNCEYCHTDRDGYIFPLDKNSHAFIDRDKIVLKANGWRGEAKIKYCPICGRRLTDGTD